MKLPVLVSLLAATAACTDVATSAPDADGATDVPSVPDNMRGYIRVRSERTGEIQTLPYVAHGGRAIYQGDIDLGPVPAPTTDRSVAILGSDHRWPNSTVHFVIRSDVAPDSRNRIIDAMAEWSRRVPVVQFAGGFAPSGPTAVFIPSTEDDVSRSPIGPSDLDDGSQTVVKIFPTHGTDVIEHEVGHLLGLAHEATHPNRETFVHFDANCVRSPDDVDEFTLGSGSWFLFPYDFDSIMHYGSGNFCKRNAFDTCVCQPLTCNATALQSHGLDDGHRCRADGTFSPPSEISAEDARMVNFMYDKGLAGPDPLERFGAVLAKGDFNGDGFTDLVVAAPFEVKPDNGSGRFGSVFVYRGYERGFENWRRIDDIDVNELAREGDRFGQALVVGDFNNDTIDDLAIGVPGAITASHPNIHSGAAFVLLGSKASGLRLDALGVKRVDASLTNLPFGESNFGASLAAGDLDGNHDGDELVVGSPDQISGGLATGWVNAFTLTNGAFAHRVGYGMPATANGQANDHFGMALAVADFDDDGRADVAIGAPNHASAGAVYVYSSTAAGHATGVAVPVPGSAGASDRIGVALGTGNVNDARYSSDNKKKQQLLIGAPGRAGSGRIFVMSPVLTSGVLSWNSINTISKPSPAAFDDFGLVFTVIDTNNDAFDDLVAGVPNDDANGANAGRIFLYRGSSTGLTSGFDINSVAPMSSAGDLWGSAVLVGKLDRSGGPTLVGSSLGANSGGGLIAHFDIADPATSLFRDEASAFPLRDFAP
jgi:Astacin (Peptidase family M12A)/FG-GAP repeat